MFITRGFVAQIVDGKTPTANVILTVGNVVLPIFELKAGVSTPTSTIYSSGLETTNNWIATYINEPEYVSGVALFNNYGGKDATLWANAINRGLALAPIAQTYDVSGAFGQYYFRLLNATGRYAVTDSVLPSQYGSRAMSFYDADGTFIGGAPWTIECCAQVVVSGQTRLDLTWKGSLIVPNGSIVDGGLVTNLSWHSLIGVDGYAATGETYRTKNRFTIFGANTTTSTNNNLVRFINNTTPFPPEVTDPYANLDTPGDDPIPGGGTVGIPGFPGLTATSAGVIGLFAPTTAQMQQLADFMWTDFGGTATDVFEVLQELVEAVKRSISNPLDYIIGLNIIPSQGLSIGNNKVVRFGFVSSGVSMPQLSNQYFTVDCGSLSFDTLCGDTFLDYAPYSKFSIYLPYIGFKDVDPNDFVGHTIGVVYHGDVVTGGVTAYITKDGSVMYQYSGCCALNVPLSADNWGETISAAINVATGIVAAAASGGAAGVATAAAKGAANVAANPSLLSPQVSHSGAVSGGAGCMGVQYPFVIREAVNFHSTAGFNKSTGYPAYYYKQLADVSGFTTVIEAHMNGIPMATQDEIQEIESLLESGVIL